MSWVIKFLKAWRGYTDEAAFIFAETDGEPHNTITPIARKRGGEVRAGSGAQKQHHHGGTSLWASSIRTQNLHHIKKENIGLIEVMGLAVLPARLKEELALLADYMVNGKDIRSCEAIEKHADWVTGFLPKYGSVTGENVMEILKNEVGLVFAQVLLDAGVYKRTEDGKEAFLRFADFLNR